MMGGNTGTSIEMAVILFFVLFAIIMFLIYPFLKKAGIVEVKWKEKEKKPDLSYDDLEKTLTAAAFRSPKYLYPGKITVSNKRMDGVLRLREQIVLGEIEDEDATAVGQICRRCLGRLPWTCVCGPNEAQLPEWRKAFTKDRPEKDLSNG